MNARPKDPSKVKCRLAVAPDADALYIQIANEIRDGEAVANETFQLQSRATEVVLDFNSVGQLLGIEILGIEGLLPDKMVS